MLYNRSKKMTKTKEFLDNFKLEKALNGYECHLNYGDKVHMFNNFYKVVSFNKSGYTMMEDNKDQRFAIPSKKLMLLMKKNLAKNYGSIVVQKAEAPTSGSPKIGGSSPQAGKGTSGAAPTTGSGQQRGQPVGTTKQAKDGQWYKKISANPSVWAHVQNGNAKKDSPDGEDVHHLHDPKDVETHHKMLNVIEQKTSPSDHKELKDKLDEFIKQRAKFKNMQAVHSVGDVDDDTGKRYKQAPKVDVVERVNREGEKARKMFQGILDLVKESHKKLKG